MACRAEQQCCRCHCCIIAVPRLLPLAALRPGHECLPARHCRPQEPDRRSATRTRCRRPSMPRPATTPRPPPTSRQALSLHGEASPLPSPPLAPKKTQAEAVLVAQNSRWPPWLPPPTASTRRPLLRPTSAPTDLGNGFTSPQRTSQAC